jgi:hypothetical protein
MLNFNLLFSLINSKLFIGLFISCQQQTQNQQTFLFLEVEILVNFFFSQLGTCLAYHLASERLQNQVVIYSRNKQVSETINKERYNPKYLSTYKLRDKVSATSELTKETFEKTHVILMCIPTPQLRSVLKSIQAFVTEEHLLILANKGNFLNSKPFKELKWKRWICLIKLFLMFWEKRLKRMQFIYQDLVLLLKL